MGLYFSQEKLKNGKFHPINRFMNNQFLDHKTFRFTCLFAHLGPTMVYCIDCECYSYTCMYKQQTLELDFQQFTRL